MDGGRGELRFLNADEVGLCLREGDGPGVRQEVHVVRDEDERPLGGFVVSITKRRTITRVVGEVPSGARVRLDALEDMHCSRKAWVTKLIAA